VEKGVEGNSNLRLKRVFVQHACIQDDGEANVNEGVGIPQKEERRQDAKDEDNQSDESQQNADTEELIMGAEAVLLAQLRPRAVVHLFKRSWRIAGAYAEYGVL